MQCNEKYKQTHPVKWQPGVQFHFWCNIHCWPPRNCNELHGE